MASIAEVRPARGTALLVGLIFAVVLLNYVDRGAIAISAPSLKPELGLNATQFGIAVSAFFWVYAPIQYGTGWVIDRWCVYRLLAAGVALWALSTMLTSLVPGLFVLVALRCLLGLGESFTFPAATKIIARHVPADRRGLANAAVAMGIALGPAVGTLAGGLILARHGWRPVFAIFGALTLLWIVPWLLVSRRLPAYRPEHREAPVKIAPLLRTRAVWAMGLVHFTATWGVYFAVTWFPLYLVQSRGLAIERMTYIATMGFIAQGASALLLGWGSDVWTRSGRDEAACRRWMMVIAQTILAGAIVGLMFARSDGQVLLWMVAIGAANGASGLNLYAVAQMFAGTRATGTFVGVQNATGNMSGIIGPIVTGWIIDTTGAYSNAFWLTAAVALAGAVGWWLAVPPIAPIDLEVSGY